ncbi:hypothetical protein MDA_GLEAN10002126 [Myotis davidii]|uniref:Uncharacterized protein n=1 Tax=Myotis davidii TaxID=225400 RepID=L5MG05_MYODS|nr:hypothetical protein MDA_GLEAN10002126 [Myotis davidii]
MGETLGRDKPKQKERQRFDNGQENLELRIPKQGEVEKPSGVIGAGSHRSHPLMALGTGSRCEQLLWCRLWVQVRPALAVGASGGFNTSSR